MTINFSNKNLLPIHYFTTSVKFGASSWGECRFSLNVKWFLTVRSFQNCHASVYAVSALAFSENAGMPVRCQVHVRNLSAQDGAP